MSQDFDDASPPPRRPGQTVDEYRLEQLEKRLSAGAGTFSEIRKAISATHDAIAATDKRAVRILGSLFLAALAGVAAAAVLLYRVDETQETQEKHETKLETVTDALKEVKTEQVRLNTAVEGIEYSIDEKLDKAINPPADPITGKKRRPR